MITLEGLQYISHVARGNLGITREELEQHTEEEEEEEGEEDEETQERKEGGESETKPQTAET